MDENQGCSDHQRFSRVSEDTEVEVLQARCECKMHFQKIGRHWHFWKRANDHYAEETRANEPGSGGDL